MDDRIRFLLAKLKLSLKEIYGERLKGVYLYGSYAKGTQKPSSDIDVVFILDDFKESWSEIQRTGALTSALSLEFDITVSLIPMKEADFRNCVSVLALNVAKEGIAV